MDDDLEKILDDIWKKKPQPTIDYCKVKATLLLVQELRKPEGCMMKIKEMKYCPWCGSNLQECFQYEAFYEQNTILYCEKCDSFVERYIATHFIEEINKLEKKIENIKNIVEGG